jgi:hypothetical protein
MRSVLISVLIISCLFALERVGSALLWDAPVLDRLPQQAGLQFIGGKKAFVSFIHQITGYRAGHYAVTAPSLEPAAAVPTPR